MNRLGIFGEMNNKILKLKRQDHPAFKNGLLVPYNEQIKIFVHFSMGCISVTYDRLEEITEVAEMHGWTVEVLDVFNKVRD